MGALETLPVAESFSSLQSFIVSNISERSGMKIRPSTDDILMAGEMVLDAMDALEARALLVTLLENDRGVKSAEIFGITEYKEEGHRLLSPSDQAFARVGALKLSFVRNVCDLLMPPK